MTSLRTIAVVTAVLVVAGLAAPAAQATPVCTDGYQGGPPLELCGGRVFPEASNTAANIQLTPDAAGFSEFVDGMTYLSMRYPRWISVFNLREYYDDDLAVSVGNDDIRSYEEGDTGDGEDVWVVKITDHEVPDEGKQALAFSLSVHGDEIGGREGGARVAEDLAIAAEHGGTIADGVEGYESTTGVEPEIHEYEVRDVLAQEVVYLLHFNPDGWVAGDNTALGSGGINGALYTRGNGLGTDLNRQMPTVGRINSSRNPLEESEMNYGLRFMEEIAAASPGGLMAYGADVHGESQSRAFADIMYPAGQFDSIKHRQLMAIAERTKSVIDDTLYEGTANLLEDNFFGGDGGEGIEDTAPVIPSNTIPVKPARWGTVWDTLGYTDTGFIGDYMANELGVTGMDYEIALNHADFRAFGRFWSVILQENYINATRAIVTTAMAYALHQDDEFAELTVDTAGGRVGYVLDPNRVTDTDENGPGRLPGPDGDGIGNNGEPVEQRPYSASQMDFFTDSARFVEGGFVELLAVDVAAVEAGDSGSERPGKGRGPKPGRGRPGGPPGHGGGDGGDGGGTLADIDSLVIADLDLERGAAPVDGEGRTVDPQAFWGNLDAWVRAGGNLILTDRALHGLSSMGVLAADDVFDVNVYQPYANFVDRSHPMAAGLRANARQLAEFTLIGFGIGNSASPMTLVDTAAFEAAGGHVVGTTGNSSGGSDDGSRTAIGELPLGDGVVRILGGGLHRPSEDLDHRYGLKDYALTYSGLYVLENSLAWDCPTTEAPAATVAGTTAESVTAEPASTGSSPAALPSSLLTALLGAAAFLRRFLLG